MIFCGLLDTLQDSIRNGSLNKAYQAQLIKYYEKANDLNELVKYAYSFMNCNRDAHYTISMYLVNLYSSISGRVVMSQNKRDCIF